MNLNLKSELALIPDQSYSIVSRGARNHDGDTGIS